MALAGRAHEAPSSLDARKIPSLESAARSQDERLTRDRAIRGTFPGDQPIMGLAMPERRIKASFSISIDARALSRR